MFQFFKIFYDLCSPWLSLVTRIAMFKVLHGGVRRTDRQHTLRLVSRGIRLDYVTWPDVSVPVTVVVLSADVNLPPSLLASASSTLFQLVLELDQFVLTSETTYSQYVQAVSSRRVPTRRLLPPNFPVIRLRFRCDVSHKVHGHCQGNGTWEVEMKRTFRSDIEAIRSLAEIENLF